jgi:hypothetical protein
MFALDNTIKGGFELRQRIDIPVLGEIPSFPDLSKKQKKVKQEKARRGGRR